MLKFTKRQNSELYATIKCEFNVNINDIANIIYAQRFNLKELNNLTKTEIENIVRNSIRNGGENAIYFNDVEDWELEEDRLATYDECVKCIGDKYFENIRKMFLFKE